MAEITAKWVDNNLARFGKGIDDLNKKFPKVLPRIVNQVGERAKTQVIRALTKQTGLKRDVIVRAVGDPKRAHAGALQYVITTSGGNVRLKHFAPAEFRYGVRARPWGKVTKFPGAFTRGGRFPQRRETSKLGGHVWRRNNASGTHITQVRSGVFIPREMTEGATKAAFERVAGPLLQQRVEKAIAKLMP